MVFSMPVDIGLERMALVNTIRYLSSLSAGELQWTCNGQSQVYRFEYNVERCCERCRTQCGENPMICNTSKMAMDMAMDSVEELQS